MRKPVLHDAVAMASRSPDAAFWRGRRVLLTGHTGFKGAWLHRLLHHLEAEVYGLSLEQPDGDAVHPVVFGHTGSRAVVDLTDAPAVLRRVGEVQPSVVLHLAAQALVPVSQADPAGTWRSNVGGTLHLLEAVDATPGVEGLVVTTTDKVYRNSESGRPFREGDPLGGEEPYSASKAATEHLVHSWPSAIPVATARAGNVIGGGDRAPYRLIPDAVRAMQASEVLRVRDPDGIRPWQHVLEPCVGYLLFAESLITDPTETPSALNFGPDDEACVQVSAVLDILGSERGGLLRWESARNASIRESKLLRLDSTLAKRVLGWHPSLSLAEALEWTIDWYEIVRHDRSAGPSVTDTQIEAYLARLASPSE